MLAKSVISSERIANSKWGITNPKFQVPNPQSQIPTGPNNFRAFPNGSGGWLTSTFSLVRRLRIAGCRLGLLRGLGTAICIANKVKTINFIAVAFS